MTQGMNRKEFIVKYNEFKYDGTKNIRLLSVKTGAGKEEKEKKEELIKKTEENIRKISALQEKLYADSKEGIIFVLQARDAAGKDSTIKHIMTGVNPQGIDVYSFKTPSKTELAHDFLWRFYKAIPERGKIAIFNRSHYEDVLVVKVHGLEKTYNIPKRCVKGDYYKKRYRHIVNFEEELYENGYRFIKIFLNVSKENCKREDLLGLFRHHFLQSRGLEAADVLRMRVVQLLFQLLSGEMNLVCVHYDHIITRIDMRGESRLIFSS